jgi:lipopolysaccharide transport system ATP-binding protein
MPSIIQVNNLSKRFTISHGEREKYTSLRDVIAQKARESFSFNGKEKRQKASKEEFWALKDVSFEINKGDRVGIVGRNGAGKSTLLKILSRVTAPTTGRITIDGRVASLLEVGTGFHLELTGRENIFLNGAILGMSRMEIQAKFDEIVAFAEIEKFLDTPVKHYSSGMYVRLAFAVAAHLEPEVLIVDEVLAVGDVQFQKKCMGKMEDVSKNEGRTVLFVSHNTTMLLRLCNRGILLKSGKIVDDDSIFEVVSRYNQSASIAERPLNSEGDSLFVNDNFLLKDFYLMNENNGPLPQLIDVNECNEIKVVMSGEILKPDTRLCIGFEVINEHGERLLYNFQTDQPEGKWPVLNKGAFRICADLPLDFFNEGKYMVNFISALYAEKMLVTGSDAITRKFELVANRSQSPYWQGKKDTPIAPVIRFYNA